MSTSTTLPLFWNLSSGSKTERIDASVKLVGALEQFQTQFTPPPESSSDEEDEEEEMDTDQGDNNDKLDARNAPDVSYSIRRLVRGLASPRESSRLGFAVALTELLSRLDSVSASQILSLISQASQIHGSMKGQEERDTLFARLFGITSLTQSGLLFRSTPLSTSSVPACTFQDFQTAMTMLLALPSQKSFLREPSYWTFVLALRALGSSTVGWKDEGWTWVVDTVFSEDKSWSPEKVGVALALEDLGVKKDWKLLLGPTFKNGDILSVGSLGNLAKILMDVDIEDPETGATKSKGSSIWRPQLHWVWNLIFDLYFPPAGAPLSKIKPKASFPDFFRVVVDESLFAPAASDGRKLWGFEVFRLSLARVPASELPRLFTPNFMRSWVNHLSKADRYLHKAAKLVASSLPPVIAANPAAGFPLLLQLTQTHGHFDRLTRTKTVESMLSAMNVEGVQEYIGHLGDLARSPGAKASGESEDDPTAIRIWVADQFSALVRNGAIPKADSWVTDVLSFFLLHGLFGIRKKNEKSNNRWLHVLPDPAFSDEARAVCRTRLLACLAELTSQTTLVKTGDDKTVRGTSVASDGELWVSKVLHGIVSLENDTKHVLRLGLGDEEVQEETALRDRTLQMIEKLRNVSNEQKESGEGAELLLVATLLYRYLNDERESDEDVEACLTNVTRLFPDSTQDSDKKKKKKKKSLDIQDAAETDVEPMDALVDTLIGYLEKSTAYLRVVANQVFTQITPLVDKSTVDLILTQLERRDPTREEAEDDDVLLTDQSLGENAASDSETSDSDSGENVDDDEDEDLEDDPELREKIEDALRINGIQAATDGSDEGSDLDSSEEVMDDDQMMQLDEHLAEIFRSRAKEKGRGDTGAQREATHFKNRVLDLVDIFLRKQPTSKLVPCFLLPLVQVIMGTGPDEKQLSDKVTALLRSRIGKAKELPAAVDLPEAQKTLEELHVMARKTHSADVRDTINACSLYLTKVLLSESANDVVTVTSVYRASLADFATRKASPLQPSFIQDFVRRYPRAAWQIRDDFVLLANKAVNGYRKCQTLQLLNPLLNQVGLASASPAEITNFMGTLRQAVYANISDACDETESLTASQVKELLKLCLLAVRQTKRFSKDANDLPLIWDAPGLTNLISKLDVSRFKTTTSLSSLCKQLRSIIGSNTDLMTVEGRDLTKTGNQKKRKAEETKEDGNVKKARRKKSKKSRDP